MLKRTLIRTVLAAVVAITAINISIDTRAEAASRITHQQRSDIRYQRLDHAKWTNHEVLKTIRSAVRKWPVSGGASKAISVARCESGLNERASNGGSYLGVFQQSARYWPGRQNVYDSPRWHLAEKAFNARANIIVSIRQAHSGGWGPWACA